MNKKKNVLEFKSKRKVSKKSREQNVVEEGKISGLTYKVFKRGVVHITDGKLLFKKDCDLFEDAINELDLNSLKEDDVKKIPGSGDNDTLIFTCKDGDIVISLERPEFSMMAKLKSIIGIAKKTKKKGGK